MYSVRVVRSRAPCSTRYAESIAFEGLPPADRSTATASPKPSHSRSDPRSVAAPRSVSSEVAFCARAGGAGRAVPCNPRSRRAAHKRARVHRYARFAAKPRTRMPQLRRRSRPGRRRAGIASGVPQRRHSMADAARGRGGDGRRQVVFGLGAEGQDPAIGRAPLAWGAEFDTGSATTKGRSSPLSARAAAQLARTFEGLSVLDVEADPAFTGQVGVARGVGRDRRATAGTGPFPAARHNRSRRARADRRRGRHRARSARYRSRAVRTRRRR